MSRFAVLLVVSALMLIVAACDADDDTDDTNGTTDDTTELPTDDGNDDETDVVVPEDDDATGTDTDDDVTAPEDDGTTPDDDATTPDDGVTTPEADDATDPDDDPLGQDDEQAVDPDAIQPDPNEGIFFDLSFEEAQDLSPFELQEPAEVPEGVEFQTIMGMASPDATEEQRSEEATTIVFSYMQAPTEEAQQGLPVELTQSTEMDMSEGLPPEAEQEEITIGDREVTRIQLAYETGEQIVAYTWQDGEVYFSLAAILGPDLEEQELEDMVASVPAS